MAMPCNNIRYQINRYDITLVLNIIELRRVEMSMVMICVERLRQCALPKGAVHAGPGFSGVQGGMAVACWLTAVSRTG